MEMVSNIIKKYIHSNENSPQSDTDADNNGAKEDISLSTPKSTKEKSVFGDIPVDDDCTPAFKGKDHFNVNNSILRSFDPLYSSPVVVNTPVAQPITNGSQDSCLISEKQSENCCLLNIDNTNNNLAANETSSANGSSLNDAQPVTEPVVESDTSTVSSRDSLNKESDTEEEFCDQEEQCNKTVVLSELCDTDGDNCPSTTNDTVSNTGNDSISQLAEQLEGIKITDSHENKNETLMPSNTMDNEIMDLKSQLEELHLQLREKEQENKKLQEQLEKATSNKQEFGTIENTKILEVQLVKQKEGERYENLLQTFEASFNDKVNELKRWKEENEVAKRHLAAVEDAFSDLLQKYERCKNIIEAFKKNEDTLKQNVQMNDDTNQKMEEKYDTLRSHAKAQLDKCNKEIINCRDSYEKEITKLTTIIKRLEINCDSLNNALEQKKKECKSLTELVDEMTGKNQFNNGEENF